MVRLVLTLNTLAVQCGSCLYYMGRSRGQPIIHMYLMSDYLSQSSWKLGIALRSMKQDR
jgi:hypothetical protein